MVFPSSPEQPMRLPQEASGGFPRAPTRRQHAGHVREQFGPSRSRVRGIPPAWAIMPPPRRSLSDLGAVSRHGNGWRVRVNIDGTQSSGPLCASEAEARADLERARQSATREEMSKYLEDCGRTAAGDVPPLAAAPAAADPAPMAAPVAPSRAAPAGAGSAGSAAMPVPRPEAAPAVSPRTPRPAKGSCGADDAADVTHAFTVHGAELALAMLHGRKLVALGPS